MVMAKKQAGFISIITVITLSILLSLLTLAFVKVMNRSMRQTLDTQLSTQANYAAETGINDAIKAIISNPAGIAADDTDCAPTPISATANVTNQAQLGSGAAGAAAEAYTCQLISSGVKDVLATITDQTARIYPVKTDIVNASNVVIEWEDQATKSNFNTGAADSYQPLGSWPANAPAMLRVTLFTPCPGGCADFNRSALINNQKNFFIKPGTVANATLNYSDADGTASLSDCQNINNGRPFACKITINLTGINTSQSNALFMKISPMYGSASVRFMGNNATGSPLAMYGAQYRIDVTGKANDVYRRLEVRLPLASYVNPGTGIESANVCKKFEWSGSAKLSDACP